MGSSFCATDCTFSSDHLLKLQQEQLQRPGASVELIVLPPNLAEHVFPLLPNAEAML